MNTKNEEIKLDNEYLYFGQLKYELNRGNKWEIYT